ncbi:hypothetical protein ACVIGB_008800 [Bradyrhizobium sp. USDA 4341]
MTTSSSSQRFAFVIGSAEEEVKRKQAELDSYVSIDAFLVQSNLGEPQDDSRPYPPETLLKYIET